jgi:hypothetical protein
MTRRQRVRVFVRHCGSPPNVKPRPEWFDRRECLRQLLDTADDGCRVTVVFDGDPTGHFVNDFNVDVVRVDGGTDARSFAGTMAVVQRACESGAVADDDVVYLAEDDYWHLPGWAQAFREGLGAFDYVTAYDHPDKYDKGYKSGAGPGSRCDELRIVPTASTHWRTAPSTTNTFAALARTLKADMHVHTYYTTADHEKFVDLWYRGRTLGTCLPALATHCEAGMLSPVVDWAAAVKRGWGR